MSQAMLDLKKALDKSIDNLRFKNIYDLRFHRRMHIKKSKLNAVKDEANSILESINSFIRIDNLYYDNHELAIVLTNIFKQGKPFSLPDSVVIHTT